MGEYPEQPSFFTKGNHMSEELNGNCLIAQSGGPTAVINSSLAGAITEALNHPCIEEIYGARNGVVGILQEDLIDLAEESQQVIRGLRTTPASALGTCRYKLKKQEDFDRILQVFQTHNIRYFFYIGGNDSQDSADRIGALAAERGYDLRVIGIPKTIDNDLVGTDHCPGYGSAVKYLCTTVSEMAADCQAMGNHDYVAFSRSWAATPAGWRRARPWSRARTGPTTRPTSSSCRRFPFVHAKAPRRRAANPPEESFLPDCGERGPGR